MASWYSAIMGARASRIPAGFLPVGISCLRALLSVLGFFSVLFPSVSSAEQTPTQQPPLPLESVVFSWGGYIQALGAVFLLLGVLCGVAWLLRRYGKFRFLPRPENLPRDALVLEMQLPLGPRKGLTVVRFMNKRLLLGTTEHSITLLSEDDIHHEQQSESFQKILEDVSLGGSADDGRGNTPSA